MVAIAIGVIICLCKDKKDDKKTPENARENNYRQAAPDTERAFTDGAVNQPTSPRREPRRAEQPVQAQPQPVRAEPRVAQQQQPVRAEPRPVQSPPRSAAVDNGIEVEQNRYRGGNDMDLEMVPRTAGKQEEIRVQVNKPQPVAVVTADAQEQNAKYEDKYLDSVATHIKQRISIARRDPASQQKRRDDNDDDAPEGESSEAVHN